MIRIEAALLTVLILACPAWAEPAMNPDGYFIQNTNDFQQDVSGEGYAMIYQHVNTNNLSVKNYMHGSGSMDMATLISSQQKKPVTVDVYSDPSGGIRSYKNYDSTIAFTEQNEMTQSPYSFAYGTGWYANHPIQYNSLLKEKTDSKNYQAGSSIQHQIEYARAFEKDVDVDLNCTGATTKEEGTGLNKMRVEESVTEGTVHVGEMLTQNMDKKKGIRGSADDPLILIDENYVGSFKIKKSMAINAVKKKPSEVSDWLPCCFGGYFDMEAVDRRYSADGVFDCTCRASSLKSYKPAWNGSTAQFPNDIYAKKP
jgi:hypothetical protein